MAKKTLILMPSLCMLVAGLLGLRFQITPSLPYGVYLARRYAGGRLVGFCPKGEIQARTWRYRTIGSCPDWRAELQKPVLGHPGDRVILSERGISLNGELLPNTAPYSADHQGRDIAHYPFGTYTITKGELWTVSTHTSRSVDSRYYGPVPIAQVREEMMPLWTW